MNGIYTGIHLDMLLKNYGFSRNPDECDWDFRKRVFPDLYQKNHIIAFEVLVAQRSKEWHGLLKWLVAALIYFVKPSRELLEKYVQSITGDPSAPPKPWQLPNVS